jgi:hypothetical protein
LRLYRTSAEGQNKTFFNLLVVLLSCSIGAFDRKKNTRFNLQRVLGYCLASLFEAANPEGNLIGASGGVTP